MADNLLRFRRIKHGTPKKLKVLAEDLQARPRPYAFGLAVVLCAAGAFTLAYLW